MSADFTGFAGLHADLDGVLLRGSLAVVYFFVGKALLAARTDVNAVDNDQHSTL